MNNPILKAVSLKKMYHDGHSRIEVLTDVNLEVNPSELVAIVGNSGSGKSTLLHLLGGLDKPTSGQVMLAGKNIHQLSETEKCYFRNHHLGFVYQFHHLLPEFTAVENVCMPLLIQSIDVNEAESRAEKILDQVGLKNRLSHKMSELSGGERQRVAIARALVTNPLCVLADEPTGNLDPKNAEKVLELFFGLQKSYQTSIVIVTHDTAIAKRAERLFTLNDGQLVQA